MKNLLYFICITIGCAALLPAYAYGQSRDFLTDDEIEMVRDAQQIDIRIDVLTHAIDRRLAVLKIESAPAKESAGWGKLPEGTRLELLNDIKRILQKAIDDIDNLAERPDSMVIEEPDRGKKPKAYGDVFPKVVRSLAKAAARYQPLFKAQLDSVTDGQEKGIILDSLDMCAEITAAATKLKN